MRKEKYSIQINILCVSLVMIFKIYTCKNFVGKPGGAVYDCLVITSGIRCWSFLLLHFVVLRLICTAKPDPFDWRTIKYEEVIKAFLNELEIVIVVFFMPI